ncbi:hypothetical protein HELRODRAFT_184079 [Helobdella robusta]|uniref:Uncharacterized protein n=1 Tax=Helobdella robusta TaxID=6412 RepID=T1FKJ3_HELRO|nr:hypothetical protein HELRODRAFT_184079 [Helobdella robusta]ESO08288.1 hypothetical protein HELRODRAFT_184079 [Helobdella robusta]
MPGVGRNRFGHISGTKKSVEHLTKSTSAGSLNDSLQQLAAVVVPKLAEQICGRCERSLSHDEAVLRNICWYHKRFAENSKKCVPPCSYYSEAVATTSRKKSNRHLNHASASKERSKTSKQKKSVEHLTKSTSAGSLNDSLQQLAAVVVPKLAEQICGRCERSLSHDEAVLRNICWYHKRFAENSKKCVPPCSYYSEAVATTSRKKSNRHLNHASASKERSKTSKQLEHDLRFVLDFITCRFLVVFNLYQ